MHTGRIYEHILRFALCKYAVYSCSCCLRFVADYSYLFAYSALAKVGKDVAAGAVFVTAVAAVIIGVILFWDIEKFKIIFEFFTGDIWNLAMLTAFACLSYLFIAKGKKRNIKGKMKNE